MMFSWLHVCVVACVQDTLAFYEYSTREATKEGTKPHLPSGRLTPIFKDVDVPKDAAAGARVNLHARSLTHASPAAGRPRRRSGWPAGVRGGSLLTRTP